VRVPATSANLGPGFDCLGMALGMWNRVHLQWGGPDKVVIHGEGADRLWADRRNLTYRAAQRLLDEVGVPASGMQITAWQEVPLARGLGSSACAIVSGLAAANALLGSPVPAPRLLELATDMEGHPDNVAPALLGGCCIAVRDGSNVLAAPVPLPPDLQCVVYIPDEPLSTKRARDVLKSQISRQDVVFNLGRTALLVAGLATNHLEYLRVATQDRLHQPARQQVFPAMKRIFESAMRAGAKGVFLSGAGSSIMALTVQSEHRAATIGYEMADAADKARIPGTFRVLDSSPTGVEVLELDEEE
jgi:homoserine kinase